MWRALIPLCVLLTQSSVASADNVLAFTRTPPWGLTILESGASHSSDCQVWLRASTNGAERRISLKREFFNCALYGPIALFATASKDYKRLSIVVEAARGGDGGHTGPILEFFSLDEQGLRKLGEQELFDASYVRRERQLTQVSGTALFSLCDTCDGPDVTSPAENIYVPVRITFGCDGICVKAAVNPSQAEAIRKTFLNKKKKALAQGSSEPGYSRHVEEIESSLNHLLDSR
jgi:hypothetical protein